MDRRNQVDHVHERLHALKSIAAQHCASLDLGDIAALSAALEQLELAQIEMRQRNEELVAAHDALEHERTRYRDLFDLAPDAYLITDAQGLVSEANCAARQLLKVERKLLIGKPLQTFVPPEERDSFRATVLEAQRLHGMVHRRIHLLPDSSGPVIDVDATVVAVVDHGDQPAGLRWSLRDITTQVRDEERLRDLNAELERHVADRTAALEAANHAQQHLLQRARAARDAAEEANRSRDEFLATISHELRTPLNVVLGWTFRMRSHTLDTDQSEKAVEIIDRNARQQLHLVEELLDSARIATGRFELLLDVHELGPLLRTAVDALEATAAAKSIAIRNEIGAGIYVRADPVRIRQIAWNLLSNALKFTPERGAVAVSLSASDGHAVVSVRDSGDGIPSTALGRIFEPFWQVDRSTHRSRSGLGLGLAIVKHLVELHGGEVDATSDGTGRGTTFTVRLPLVAASQVAAGA
jgi:PAS domain S-box-containing protein